MLKSYQTYLSMELKMGFSIGHNVTLNNLNTESSTVPVHLNDILMDKLKSEIKLGRIAGPFIDPHFNDFQISQFH